MGSELVKEDHPNRKAVVYMRQSTPQKRREQSVEPAAAVCALPARSRTRVA